MLSHSVRLLSAWLEREQGVVASPEELIELEKVVEKLGSVARNEACGLPFGKDPTSFTRLFYALAEKQQN